MVLLRMVTWSMLRRIRGSWIPTLTGFCVGMGVPNAQLSGIGAIKGIELGAYDMANKEYIRQYFEDIGLPTWCIMARKK